MYENESSGGIFNVTYDKKITQYKQLCAHHGLDAKSGLRLFTTDDTTASDSFNVQYKDSIFQGVADKLGDLTRSFQDITRSVSSEAMPATRKLSADGINKMRDKGIGIAPGQAPVITAVSEVVKSVADIILTGKRLNFPKIWSNSSHSTNMSTVIKLVSPYGSPKAIYEFIIKPLTYLILLAAPHTEDGISYGDNIPITIKAYGMNYITLGAINSITLRRGGNDTSFNIYRQPLSIDVSIDFQALFDGFAVFTPGGQNPLHIPKDENIIHDYKLFNPSAENLYGGRPQSPLTTMSTLLESLKPFDFVEGNTNLFQVYGNFSRPSEEVVSPVGAGQTNIGSSFVPSGSLNNISEIISGNSISGASQSLNPLTQVSNFLNEATVSMKNMIPAEFSAAYRSANDTVNTMSTTTRTFTATVENIKPQADNVRDKVRSNFVGWGKL
jgi:hypothetical protein